MKQLVFFGSSPFSVIVLEKLLNAHGAQGAKRLRRALCAVVTTPDKPVGRHLQLTPNPVKALALKNNLLVIESFEELIKNCKLKIENCLGLVAAYGRIIPQSVIAAFAGRIYNIHPSLLPKYRGPSPLQQQILDGTIETGVTIIQLDEQMDHGPIIAQEKDTIRPDDTWISLGERLFTKGTDLILNSQFSIFNQIPIPQNHKQATFTKKLTRQDGFVDYPKFTAALESRPDWLERMFRAYHPWPGVWTLDPQGQRLKLVSFSPLQLRRQNSPKTS